MPAVIDHLLWAAPDLDSGGALFRELTGIEAAVGGTHDGHGTRNRLASLGEGVYFEIISPDPAQSLTGNLGGRIAAMPHPQLMQFALRSDHLDGILAAARGAGLQVHDPVHMGRTRPDGVRLDWSILYLDDPRWPGFLPFVIDWKGSPHPSDSAPRGCTLKEFVILHPDPQPLAEVYAALGVQVELRRASRPSLQAVLETPRGPLVLPGA